MREENVESDGINLWRQIGDTLVDQITQGIWAPGDKLPSEIELATKFGVARKTVRRALSSLQDNGLIRAEHGRGTFVTEKVLDFRIGSRTFFEQNLLENARTPSRKILEVAEIPSSPLISEKLGIRLGDAVLSVVVVGKADGLPVTLGRNYFPMAKMPGLKAIYEAAYRSSEQQNVSTAEMLKAAGIDNLRRQAMRLRCRPASPEEARLLQISLAEYVIETHVVATANLVGPALFSKGFYSSSRVEFVVEKEIFEP